jgi:hypothetical protein
MGSLSPTVELPTELMVESVFYGILLITFFASLQRLLWENYAWKHVRDINFGLLSVVLVLFASSSLNQALELLRVIEAFAPSMNSSQENLHWFDILKASRTYSEKFLL